MGKTIRHINNLLNLGIIICLLIIATTIAVLATAEQNETKGNEYPDTARIIVINYETDEVLVENSIGYHYTFKGVEDYEVGYVLSLIMNDNGTKLIYDDTIVRAKYSGYVWNDFKH